MASRLALLPGLRRAPGLGARIGACIQCDGALRRRGARRGRVDRLGRLDRRGRCVRRQRGTRSGSDGCRRQVERRRWRRCRCFGRRACARRSGRAITVATSATKRSRLASSNRPPPVQEHRLRRCTSTGACAGKFFAHADGLSACMGKFFAHAHRGGLERGRWARNASGPMGIGRATLLKGVPTS